jgi:hypothetical protein
MKRRWILGCDGRCDARNRGRPARQLEIAAKKLGAVTGPVTNSAGLDSAYSRLGIPPEKAATFTPTVLDAVGKVGGDSVRNLLAGALK